MWPFEEHTSYRRGEQMENLCTINILSLHRCLLWLPLLSHTLKLSIIIIRVFNLWTETWKKCWKRFCGVICIVHVEHSKQPKSQNHTELFRLEKTFKIIVSNPYSLPAGTKPSAKPGKFCLCVKVSFFSVHTPGNPCSEPLGTGGSKPGQSTWLQPLKMPPAPLKPCVGVWVCAVITPKVASSATWLLVSQQGFLVIDSVHIMLVFVTLSHIATTFPALHTNNGGLQ